MRVEKSGVRYMSLKELAEAYNVKPRKRNEDKAKSILNRFNNKHKCSACGEPMIYVTGNVVCCQNPQCKGVPRKNKNGEVHYLPSYNILDEIGENIAISLFDQD